MPGGQTPHLPDDKVFHRTPSLNSLPLLHGVFLWLFFSACLVVYKRETLTFWFRPDVHKLEFAGQICFSPCYCVIHKTRMTLIMFKWMIKIKRILFYDTWKLHEIQTSVTINKVLLEYWRACPFACFLQLLPCDNSWAEQPQKRSDGLKRLNYCSFYLALYQKRL